MSYLLAVVVLQWVKGYHCSPEGITINMPDPPHLRESAPARKSSIIRGDHHESRSRRLLFPASGTISIIPGKKTDGKGSGGKAHTPGGVKSSTRRQALAEKTVGRLYAGGGRPSASRLPKQTGTRLEDDHAKPKKKSFLRTGNCKQTASIT